jgi:hypothetical protein
MNVIDGTAASRAHPRFGCTPIMIAKISSSTTAAILILLENFV